MTTDQTMAVELVFAAVEEAAIESEVEEATGTSAKSFVGFKAAGLTILRKESVSREVPERTGERGRDSLSSTGEVNLDFGKTGVLGSRTDLGDLYLDPFGSDSLGEVDRETSRSVVGKSAERDSSSIAESDDSSENLISEVGSILQRVKSYIRIRASLIRKKERFSNSPRGRSC